MTILQWAFYIYGALLMLDFVVGTIIAAIWKSHPSDKLQAASGICIAIFMWGCALLIIPFFIWLLKK